MASTVSFAKNSRAPNQGLLKHNNREGRYADAENIDKSRSHQNVTYKKENLKEVYTELFQKSVDDYNEKQKRADRKIGDYYSKIAKSGNKEKLFQEVVVALVEKDEKVEPDTDAWEHQKVILDRYAKTFEERNPNLRVFNSVMHLDEASPHLHLSFIPIAEGYKTGMNVRNSFDKSFKDRYSSKDGVLEWYKDEREYLHTLSQEMGLETTVIGEKRKDYDLKEYKDVMRALEASQRRNKELEDINQGLVEEIAQNAQEKREMAIEITELKEQHEEMKVKHTVLKDNIEMTNKAHEWQKDFYQGANKIVKQSKEITAVEIPKTWRGKEKPEITVPTKHYKEIIKQNKNFKIDNEKLTHSFEVMKKSRDDLWRERNDNTAAKTKNVELVKEIKLLKEQEKTLTTENEGLLEHNNVLVYENEKLENENAILKQENSKMKDAVVSFYEWLDEKEESKAKKFMMSMLDKTGIGDIARAEIERRKLHQVEQERLAQLELLRQQQKEKQIVRQKSHGISL